MGSTTINCLNCKSRLAVKWVMTAKPTVRHATDLVCSECEDGDVIKRVIENLESKKPGEHALIQEVSSY